MAPLLKTGSVNPFRFWPPINNPLVFLYFRPQNLFLLWCSFRSTGVRLLEGSIPFLKQLHHGGGSRLLVSNHISFIDPHILTELNFKSPGLRFHWLAGIEPFEKPVLRFHLQYAGAFSIDRGMVDTRSVTFTQRCLNTGDRPLLVFPEGEATYQPTEIAPFYSGAALMALQAQHHWRHTPEHKITIFPATLIYRFANNPTARIRRDAFKLYHRLHQSLKKLNPDALAQTLPNLPSYLSPEMSTPALLTQLVSWVVLWAEHSVIPDGYTPQFNQPLLARLQNIRQWWYQTLMSEHLPGEDTQVPNDYENLMTQKNRLRSIVVRKRFAPLLGDLALAINTVQTAMEKPRHLNLRRLKRWEEEVMGFTYLEDKNPHRRLERLIVALEAMRHYATIATNASATDKARWARQTDDARRIKLISLILSDLTLMDEDHAAEPGERQWLIWDGLLTKCEILVFGEFIYRGLKAFEVAMHQPFTVREFMEQHPQASRRELIRLINDHLHHVISQPLMRASKNSVSEVTNAVLESTALV